MFIGMSIISFLCAYSVYLCKQIKFTATIKNTGTYSFKHIIAAKGRNRLMDLITKMTYNDYSEIDMILNSNNIGLAFHQSSLPPVKTG